MDLTQIENALKKLYGDNGEGSCHRVVFWNDPEREFQNELAFIIANVGDIDVINLAEVGSFEAKVRVERDAPDRKHLIYAPSAIPEPEDDWLLDIRLYSPAFSADTASMLLNDLGLTQHRLREYLAEHKKFFEKKERAEKLKTLVEAEDGEREIDLKMMAVVAKSDIADLFSITRMLFDAMVDHDEEAADLDAPSKVWKEMERLNLADAFWVMAEETFGYREDTPGLHDLLIRMLVSDFDQQLDGDHAPQALKHLLLPHAKVSNVVVFLAQWRDSSAHASSYDRLSAKVAETIHLKEHMDGLPIEALLKVMTFLDCEKAIASRLRKRVSSTADSINVDEVRSIASRRQAGHWASPNVPTSVTVPRRSLHALYDALVFAAELFDLSNHQSGGYGYSQPGEMYEAYTQSLYRFDQLYRRFCESADYAESEGWDILKKLRAHIEDCYGNGFMAQLGLKWGQFFKPDAPDCLMKKWAIPGVDNQTAFYKRNVKSLLDQDSKRKVYVIVSDAFRYEAAQELLVELNGKYRFEATLTSQLGVLPSYTSLGMAALLPHDELRYKPNGDILVDDKPASSMEYRKAILERVKGTAVSGDALLGMKKNEGRDFVREHRVIYVYHDRVDSTGDTAKTEGDTFNSVRAAIDELGRLVRHIINNLNGSQVYVTADHGFLFQESAPDQTDKTALDEKPEGTVKYKKRYLLGKNLPPCDKAYHGQTSVTAGASGDMEFWVPKAASLFNFSGGARFVHGGAMLQEIVVPVLFVVHHYGKAKLGTKTKDVEVHVLGAHHKITTSRHRFQLVQMEAVSDRVKAVTLKVAVYDGDEAVTSIETVTFDSTSGDMDERKKWVNMVLKDGDYDRTKAYRLVLRNPQNFDIECHSVPVTIDRAFTNDF